MASFSSTAARWPATGRAPAAGRPTTRPAPWRCGTPSSRPTPRTTAAGASSPTATTSIDAAAGCPPPSTDERGVVRPQGASCEIGAVEASPVTATSREDCGNCVDDDGDGRTDYEDPACCAQTAAMQVKKVLIVPGAGGRDDLSPPAAVSGRERPCRATHRRDHPCAPTSLVYGGVLNNRE